MRHRIDLSARYLTFTMFEGMPATVTPKEGGYTLRFIRNPLPPIAGMTYAEKVRATKRTSESAYVATWRGPRDIFLGYYRKSVVRRGRRFYPVVVWITAIRYDGRRVIMNAQAFGFPFFMDFFLGYFGVECLGDGDGDAPHSVLSSLLTSRTVLKGIFAQTVTNRRDALRVWAKALTGKGMTPDLDLLAEFLGNVAFEVTLADLACFTTSLNASLALLLKAYAEGADEQDREKGLTFRDLVKDAASLDITVNPRWSFKRMEAEHLANVEKMMLAGDRCLSDDDLYGKDAVVNDRGLSGRILCTEREVFAEASAMRHCLYSHYFSDIKGGRYLGISLDAPERCTVGIRLGDPVPKVWGGTDVPVACFEQVHTKRNGPVSQETMELVKDYVSRNAGFLTALMLDRQKAQGVDRQVEPPADAGDDDPDLPW